MATIDELLQAIEALEVDAEHAATVYKWDTQGGNTFDLPPEIVIRPAQALASVAGSAPRVLLYSERRLFMVTTLIKEAEPPFVMFVLGVEEGTQRHITLALRLYSESDDELARFVASPSYAFATLLDRYCLDYTADGKRVRFVPVVLIPREKIPKSMAAGEVIQAIWNALETGEESQAFQGHFMLPDGDEPARVLWPFVIATNRYQADVRRFRRGS